MLTVFSTSTGWGLFTRYLCAPTVWTKCGERLLRQDRNAPSLSFGEAEKIALSVVPVADPSDLRIHEDRDDGRRTFEASILSDGMIYDFELDAVTGEIRSYSKEIW